MKYEFVLHNALLLQEGIQLEMRLPAKATREVLDVGTEDGNPPASNREGDSVDEKPYHYAGTFRDYRSPIKKYIESNLEDSPMVSDLIEQILTTSKAGREFVQSSLSIRNATRPG